MAIDVLANRTTTTNRKYKLGDKTVLTPEGDSLLAQETNVNSSTTRTAGFLGLGSSSSTQRNINEVNYTDAEGRPLADIYSGDQTAIKKNLEKRKSLLSQGVGAGKSLLGGAIV